MHLETTAAGGIGASVRRKEDLRFLTGRGRFSDDLSHPGQVYAVAARSTHPHARIRSLDLAAARSSPGVLLVLGAADIAAEIAGPIPSFSSTPPFDIRDDEGNPAPDAAQYPLAQEKVRYLGEPIALVVAETLAAAGAAAELVTVDYEPLTAVTEIDQAVRAEAPRLWEDLEGNTSFRHRCGAGDSDAAFARAAHVVDIELLNNRLAPVFLEPRSASARFDETTGWTLELGCQSAHGMQAVLAQVLGCEPQRLRVVVADTGGGFGARGGVYPEYPVLLLAARRLGRPVKWTAERSESFLSDHQARDHRLRGSLALDAEHRFLGLRLEVDWRHGAYLTSRNVWVNVHYLSATIGGAYRIGAADIRFRGVFTNTTPQAAYRGIGRMEANYFLESLIDETAHRLGVDRLALRRRNLLGPEDLPWTAPGGAVLTSGQFRENLERAVALGEWQTFPDRRRRGAAEGRLRGIGVALYVENDGSTPNEFAEVEALGDGRILVRVGTQDFGMSHQTVFSQVASDTLGVPFEAVEVVFGDTAAVARGSGSHGSRSIRIGGGAVVHSARAVIERGRELAAEMLETASSDIVFRDGAYHVTGTDRRVALSAVAARSAERGERLAAELDFVTDGDVHANGCHLCEVSIDPADGAVRIERYVIVADVGRAINPMVVHGQIHGGAVQGIGQALLEQVVLDASSGQTLTGSFMDYALPRADDVPALVVELNEVVETDNPLGAKGAGESAATGAPAAVMSAVRDALASAGVTRIDMPATPLAVWRALRPR